jgi:hypothetical protein
MKGSDREPPRSRDDQRASALALPELSRWASSGLEQHYGWRYPWTVRSSADRLGIPRAWCGTVAAMALLSRMFRTVAITGRTDTINAWFADRQGGRWAEQTVRAAFPAHAARTPPPDRDPPHTDPRETLCELTELHRRGVVTDAEFDDLRARLRV